MQAIDAKYDDGAIGIGPDQDVMFEEEEIILNISEEGVVLESGWTITLHALCAVSPFYYISVGQLKLSALCSMIHIPNRLPNTKLTSLYLIVDYLPASCV